MNGGKIFGFKGRKHYLQLLKFYNGLDLHPADNLGYFIARTRYIDDSVQACMDQGLEQLVILGASFDSRANRFDLAAADIAVFEVDQPATQAVKKQKVNTLSRNDDETKIHLS